MGSCCLFKKSKDQYASLTFPASLEINVNCANMGEWLNYVLYFDPQEGVAHAEERWRRQGFILTQRGYETAVYCLMCLARHIISS